MASVPHFQNLLSVWLSIILWSSWATTAVQGLSPDGKALLEIKSSITDGAGILSSWDASDESPCGWYGVECLADGLSVSSLNLSYNFNSLSGTISPSIGKLSQLEHIDMAYNNFNGTLPKELGSCSELSYMDFSSNTLVSGTIPHEFGQLSKLSFLRLSGLQLTGDIPEEFGKLTSLSYVYLDNNILSGQIPSSFGDISGLIDLWLWNNNLSGSLPASLSSCRNLSNMRLNGNRLEGSIPASFGQLENLTVLDLSDNALTDQIPSELGSCTQLTHLYMGNNKLTGSIPEEMGRLSALSVLHLEKSSLTCEIPAELGNCTQLTELILGDNELTDNIPDELGRLSALSILYLRNNSLTGQIPYEIGNCTQLAYLSMENNELTGNIPSEIGHLPSLTFLWLNNNMLTGPLPPELGVHSNLSNVQVAVNQISGKLPVGLCRSGVLELLSIGDNLIEGEIPPGVAGCQSLQRFWFAGNELTGTIPKEISQNKALYWLEGSYNYLTGPIPLGIGHLSSLQMTLDLSRNYFTGSIPYQFENLRMLEGLDFSHNNLSGEIPASLDALVALTFVNISFNNFVGVLPPSWLRIISAKSIMSNPRLCFPSENCFSQTEEDATGKGLSTRSIIGITISGSVVVTIFVIIFVLLSCQRQRRKVQERDYSEGELYIWSRDSRYKNLTFQNLLDATVGSENPEIVSKTSNSTVYKATLQSGIVLAVKVLWKNMDANTESLFKREIQTIGKLRHCNLVHMIGFCMWKNLKFLILKFVNNGSLYHVLHEENGLPDWTSRYRVALGTALGLEYLHYDCVPPILHRDVKSANILLDDDLEPHITDFEYGLSFQMSEKNDVYAFGVVLLELLTGKYALDEEFPEGPNLVVWVETNIKGEHDLLSKVLDSQLLEVSENHIMQEMILVMKIALFCVNTLPAERPTMREVVTMLKQTTDSRPSQQLHIVERSDLLMAM
ncbi:hypothetical protein R1sor_026889 [Riccia sorocarpa]|uniref:non-specific serine/threonine protein kinase n=1 Tax=Riccia sorocarpa TaxID=122646 RepID=A0ABD3GE70_9MARC